MYHNQTSTLLSILKVVWPMQETLFTEDCEYLHNSFIASLTDNTYQVFCQVRCHYYTSLILYPISAKATWYFSQFLFYCRLSMLKFDFENITLSYSWLCSMSFFFIVEDHTVLYSAYIHFIWTLAESCLIESHTSDISILLYELKYNY